MKKLYICFFMIREDHEKRVWVIAFSQGGVAASGVRTHASLITGLKSVALNHSAIAALEVLFPYILKVNLVELLVGNATVFTEQSNCNN